MTEIADSEQKQQLETHLRALVPLEDCLKNPPVAPPATSTNEENEHHHHHHHRHSHRRTTTNGSRVERLESTTPQHSAEVIVFTFESVENECPGMLPEEKVRFVFFFFCFSMNFQFSLGSSSERTNETIENVEHKRIRSIGNRKTFTFSIER